MDFEEYVSANYKSLEGQTRELVEDAFKAGQQSKQAEVDGLEKKLKYEKSAYRNIKLQFLNKQRDLDDLQVEIDALKAKLEDITKWAEFHIEDYNLSESDSEHDRGWFNAACQVFKSLKGESK